MIVDNHWSLDFILKNPEFKLQDNIYIHNDKHTITYFILTIDPRSFDGGHVVGHYNYIL
jgi:hypothetical protein